jgi:hypothetical protein
MRAMISPGKSEIDGSNHQLEVHDRHPLATRSRERYDLDMLGETTISILRRLIESGQESLSPGAAEAVLQIRFTDSDQSRMSELASKSNLGTLSNQEAEEYDAYLAAADLLSLWKSKARLSLKQHPSAA